MDEQRVTVTDVRLRFSTIFRVVAYAWFALLIFSIATGAIAGGLYAAWLYAGYGPIFLIVAFTVLFIFVKLLS